MNTLVKKAFIGTVLFFGSFTNLYANAEEFNISADPFWVLKQEISRDEEILSFETKRVSAIYPLDKVNTLGANYPGFRGPGQLVVYYSDFGTTTGTNEFGTEAVIKDGVVVKLTGADSSIPRDGFVVSGHGSAKKWIKDNLKIGTKIKIEGRTLIAYTTPESYVFMAKEKIDDAEEFISNARKSSNTALEDKKALGYLKKAKVYYKKAEHSKDTAIIQYAKASIESSNLAIKYALPYMPNEFKGVWLRPSEKNAVEVRKTLDNIKQTGINNVFLETFFHGYTIYPSEVMHQYYLTTQNPKFASFDVLGTYIKEAHKRGMKIHCWFEAFYIGNSDPALDKTSILSVYPAWGNKNFANYNSTSYVRHPVEHNGLFLDPANFETVYFLTQLLSEISNKYHPDGINLDYTRYPSSQNSTVPNFKQSNWGYTEYARDEFKSLYEIDPVEIEVGTTMWKKWSEYRRSKISNFVQNAREVVPNDIKLSAVIFPDYYASLETKQQDWAKWTNEELVDVVTPLIMTSDNELFHDILKSVKMRTPNKVDIYTGLFVGFLDAEPEDLLRQISVSRALKSEGVVLFDWAHLPQKYQTALKTRVFLPRDTK